MWQGSALKEHVSLVFATISKLSMRKTVLAKTIKELVASYSYHETSAKENVDGTDTLSNISACNTICSSIIGHRFDFNDKVFHKLIAQLNSTALDHKNVSLMNYISWLKYIPCDLFMTKNITLNVPMALSLLKKFISVRRHGGMDFNDVKHFIEAYLVETNKTVESRMSTYMEDECFRKTIQEFLGAAADTKSMIMPWCEIHMASSSYLKDTTYREIKKHAVPDTPLNMQNKTKTPFLDPVIQETQTFASILDPVILETQTFASIAPLSLLKPLKVHDKSEHPCLNSVILDTQPFTSIAPLSLLKPCPGNSTLRQHTIPKESSAIPNLDSVFFDKTLRINDPVTLTAQEFITANSKLQACMELSPCWTGQNVGLGEVRDKKEMFMFLSNVFHRF